MRKIIQAVRDLPLSGRIITMILLTSIAAVTLSEGQMLYGLLNLSFWGYVAATLILVQVTIASVTIFLHRHQAHRALDLHPIMSHFFRAWLWLTTGMVTRNWVSIHRKHHATTDVEGDPHSPQIAGLKKVLFEGAELYRDGSTPDTIAKYSHGTPDDWIEKKLYSQYNGLGLVLMFIADLILFGIPGITVWAVQMIWIPFFAAGVINGIGHYWGYRNFECSDTSRNITPWAFFIGGEELHNNHHTFASSAKLSVKWWEFDIGWLYIKLLSYVGLAKVKKLPPKLAVDPSKSIVDIETFKAVFSNRFQIMSYYYNDVIAPVLKEAQAQASSEHKPLFNRAKKLLVREPAKLSARSQVRLETMLASGKNLATVYELRNKLQAVWTQTANSQVELVEALQAWIKQAEASGVATLKKFAQSMQYYVPGSRA